MALILIIENRSNLAAVSDYTYSVRVGDGTARGSREIANGTIEKHIRADGWKPLVQRVLDESNP